jgi:hypothetical protein
MQADEGSLFIIIAKEEGMEVRKKENPHLVIPDTILPASLSNTAERLSRPIGVLKRPSIQRHSQDDLIRWYALADVILYRGFGAKRRAGGILLGGEEIGLVPGIRVPGAGVVVGHEVPEVEVLVYLPEFVERKVGGSRGGGDG